MQQTVAGHRQLAEDAVRYITLAPFEYYRSLKRVFEFLVNMGQARTAEDLYPEFRRAFAAIADRATPISQVSFIKDVGHYLMIHRKTEAARRVLQRGLVEAWQRNLHGQMRQLGLLIRELEQGSSRGRLVTFGVGAETDEGVLVRGSIEPTWGS